MITVIPALIITMISLLHITLHNNILQNLVCYQILLSKRYQYCVGFDHSIVCLVPLSQCRWFFEVHSHWASTWTQPEIPKSCKNQQKISAIGSKSCRQVIIGHEIQPHFDENNISLAQKLTKWHICDPLFWPNVHW